jgi:hypothetical protein
MTDQGYAFCYNFCTITGKDYILKVIALYHSLQKHTNDFKHWVCCIDSFSYSLLMKMNLENIVLIDIKDMEDERLRKIKGERKMNEYCWTLKATFIDYLFSNYEMNSIIYLDGDIFFFSDPKSIVEEWGDHSVFLCPQRDADWVEQKYGKYQAGLIGFKRDDYGLESLKWWKEKCLEWCFAEPDKERFGDQKYLDKMVSYFNHAKISGNLGVDTAPWNCIYNNNFVISVKDGEVYINHFKLVAYHFACISIFNESEFDLWSLDPLTISGKIMNDIYVPYLEEIRAVMEKVGAVDDNALRLCLSINRSNAKTFYKYPFADTQIKGG